MASQSRPPVPAELRRAILLEAGHRCAIQTCRHSDVDIHHIIPWEKCREHSFENLIALCPNCHRRAGNGDIDRKSILFYKARLARLFNYPEEAVPRNAEGADLSWEQRLLQVSDSPDYEVSFEYPVFSLVHTPHTQELNALTEALVLQTTAPFRGISATPENLPHAPVKSVLSASFEVLLYSHDLVSLRFSIFHYGVGAAHPNHSTKTLNFQADLGIPLSLMHVFRDTKTGLSTLSRYCLAALGLDGSDWADGAAPRLENFDRFNLHSDGMPITFAEYQVGPYAAGESVVVVPWSVLVGDIVPASVVHKLASAASRPTT
jgi:hypothetical protein